jgi:dephospho-CoA kinase
LEYDYMLVVGLTGGIASGKSTVSRIFQENGVPVVCADDLARRAVEPGSSGLEEIRRVFGHGVFDAQGELDRAAMARIVFQDPEARKLLESIIHPAVSREKDRILAELESQGHEIVIVDVPLLYESSWQRNFDLVIVAYAPRDVQEQRLIQRDHMSPQEAQARLDAQMDINEKKTLADRVIDNTGDLEQTRRQVENVLRHLKALVHSKKPSAKIQSEFG